MQHEVSGLMISFFYSKGSIDDVGVQSHRCFSFKSNMPFETHLKNATGAIDIITAK